MDNTLPVPSSHTKEEGSVAPSESKTFEVALSELKITIRTPEKKKEKIKLSQDTLDTLVDTIAFHFEFMDKLPQALQPAQDSLHGLFYETFKKQFPGVNLSEADNLSECARKFIEKQGGDLDGAKVRLAVKLAEWEITYLQAISGREFKTGKIKRTKKGIEPKTKHIMTREGLIKIQEDPGWWEKHKPFGKKEASQIEIKIEGGDVLHTDPAINALLTDLQKKFINHSGWQGGRQTAEQIDTLDTRLFSLCALRSELYLKTGLSPSDVELNFIEKTTPGTYDYKTSKAAHFLGEQGVTGTRMVDIIETEGKIIAQEVKNKVQKEIDKVKKEAKAKKDNQKTVQQLKDEIEKIIQSTALDDEEKEEKINVIKAEINKLKGELKLFERKRALGTEIAEAEKTRDEAKCKVTARQVEIPLPAGETNVDLIKWAGDITDKESWRYIEMTCKLFERQMELFTQQKKELQTELKDHNAARPPSDLKKVTQVDQKGTTTTIEPEKVDIQEKQTWLKRQEDLQDQIDQLRKKINKDKWPGYKVPLVQLISQVTDVYSRRKAIVEDDPDTKQLLEAYQSAERTLKEKQDEKLKVDAEISLLNSNNRTEAVIKAEIKAKKEEEENVGAPTGKDKLEIQSLSALIDVFEADNKQAREQRLLDAEQDALDVIDYDLEHGPEWQSYPPAILRCAQLIWGDEVLFTNPPDKELADQVKGLLKSKKYLDILIQAIELDQGILDAVDIADITGAGTDTDGSYRDVNDVFPASAKIKTITIDKINRELIEKIIEEIRKKALTITAVSTP